MVLPPHTELSLLVNAVSDGASAPIEWVVIVAALCWFVVARVVCGVPARAVGI